VRLDPNDSNPENWINTSVTETEAYLYISSLVAPALGRIKKEKIVDEHPDKND